MQELLQRVRAYMPPDRVRLVEDALAYAAQLHVGQVRKSGDPYIDHPVSAARYLADLSLDAPTIAAALLHDVIEDCGVGVEELRSRFGADVARLVDGVTKLAKLDSLVEEGVRSLKPSGDAESLRKMLVAMAEDIRVVLIKLADRLHNMRTLDALSPARRVAIAQETLDIYAPLAHRLGMGEVKWQLEDLSFRYLQPNQYRAISKLLSTKRKEREDYVTQVTEVLRRELARHGFDAEITGRPKHIYSIYRKEQAYAAQGKQVGDIHDLFAVRVLVETVQECYAVLGAVHALWRPMPGSFDDYIANPKENAYQSLHTTVRAIGGLPVEVQVRTRDMHRVSEYGVASHWSYKESGAKDQRFEERMTWLRQLLEWQREVSATEEFLETVKTDIFRDQVFVYTPKNEIKELPFGSTPIDFAYRIHTELGHRCIGAKVNGRLVGLDTQLRNGDTVEVLTSKVARGPSLDWLNPHAGYAKTAGARHAIRAWFRRQERGANIERGREQLRRELRRLNAPVDEAELARIFGYEGEEEFLAAVGASIVSMAQLAGRLAARTEGPPAPLAPTQSPQKGAAEQPTGITVLGVGDLLTRMAACCTPVPGDDIIGFITRMRGVTVHRRDCPNVRAISEPERLVQVDWGTARNTSSVRMRIEAFDRVGLLHDITGAVSTEGVNITASSTEVGADGEVVVHVTLQVTSLEQLSRLFTRVEAVRGVRSASRAVSGDGRTAQPR
ncbi:MAG: bifunctional (p)ppGpp synthetase/guanosine-3',5'-bis(diphosphate) 3'-pyrophosphohydrolase [Chloroflexota bacterium]